MFSITYYELSQYNAGKLVSKEFDLDGKTFDEHRDEVNEWLDLLPACSQGFKREEIIVADYEGVPKRYVDEYCINRNFFDFLKCFEESFHTLEVFEAGAELQIDLDKIDCAYVGEFENENFLGMHLAEEENFLNGLPRVVSDYFDYSAYGRDQSINYLSQHGKHYFRNYL